MADRRNGDGDPATPRHGQTASRAPAGSCSSFITDRPRSGGPTGPRRAPSCSSALRRYPSAEFACPSFTDVNGRMFYLGRDVRHGHELWTSDGTVAGTTFVADLRPGRKSSYPQIVGRAGDQVIFRTAYPPVLWASDATAADTTKLQRSVYADSPNSLGGDPTLNGALFFTTAPEGADAGSELWRTDGTPQGTVMVKEIRGHRLEYPAALEPLPSPMSCSSIPTMPSTVTSCWMTDGTNAGTTLLKDINPGANARLSGPPCLSGRACLLLCVRWGAPAPHSGRAMGRPPERSWSRTSPRRPPTRTRRLRTCALALRPAAVGCSASSSRAAFCR